MATLYQDKSEGPHVHRLVADEGRATLRVQQDGTCKVVTQDGRTYHGVDLDDAASVALSMLRQA